MVYATHLLQGVANDWWTQEQVYEENKGNCTWDTFVKALYKHYFPKSVRQQKERKFLDLVQGNRTVD
uniref:Retrotransposon gag domain-containing protein n=1 Tax=Nelumbo nucifera TaxID=4432 RepID=A0A822YG42_NELNU|nr:TPA_asm: hypothetical protein HUJ06_031414 [Nelumbo nucifera]